MTTYIVVSDREVAGKQTGDQLTDVEITAAGGDPAHLLEAGHIAPATPSKADPAITTPKE